MKKIYLIIAMAVSTLALNAQQTLNLSTYNGTNLEKYDGKECKVNVNRYVFTGWNTIALPFAVSESELNETFGSDCKLEKLVGAEEQGGQVTLYFQDCKASGIEANVPYILYYNGESSNKRLSKMAMVTNEEAVVGYMVKGSSEYVTMAGVRQHTDGAGLYGVLAVDNGEAKFVRVDETKGGFYASRCYVKLSSGNFKQLGTVHIGAGETASISDVISAKERVDVYTLSGVKVASGMNASQVNKLQPGVYVVNGQKIAVK